MSRHAHTAACSSSADGGAATGQIANRIQSHKESTVHALHVDSSNSVERRRQGNVLVLVPRIRRTGFPLPSHRSYDGDARHPHAVSAPSNSACPGLLQFAPSICVSSHGRALSHAERVLCWHPIIIMGQEVATKPCLFVDSTVVRILRSS